jgi:serine/threonine-protein kinase
MLYYLITGGTALRFSASCGQAYRDHQAGGAALLRQRHGGAIPATLQAGEEQRFVEHITDGLAAIARQLGDPDWRPAPTPFGGCADAALRLLRALLAPDPADRPGHALEISRLLANVSASLLGPLTVAPRALPHSFSRPTAHNGWPARGSV